MEIPAESTARLSLEDFSKESFIRIDTNAPVLTYLLVDHKGGKRTVAPILPEDPFL